MLAISVTSCSSPPVTKTVTPAELSRLTEMKVPESAFSIVCGSESGMDTLVYGRFHLNAEDVDAFIAGLPNGTKIASFDGYSNVTSHNVPHDWWPPSALVSPRKANWSLPGFSGNLLIGTEADAEKVTVYFFNFTL